MSCDDVRQFLLEWDQNATDDLRAQQVLAHLETCPETRQAAADYQRLAELLAVPDEQAQPLGGWARFERRLEQVVQSRTKSL
jgi:predicted anti-sigma-YlaC factor YlaD